jgi:hypothetical protein
MNDAKPIKSMSGIVLPEEKDSSNVIVHLTIILDDSYTPHIADSSACLSTVVDFAGIPKNLVKLMLQETLKNIEDGNAKIWREAIPTVDPTTE